jgi:hypothetical protein
VPVLETASSAPVGEKHAGRLLYTFVGPPDREKPDQRNPAPKGGGNDSLCPAGKSSVARFFPDREKHTRPVDRGSVCRSALRHHGDTTDLSKRALLAPLSTVFEVHPLRRDAIDPVALHGRDEGVGVGRGRHALRVRRPLVTDVNVEARLPGAGPSQA